MGRHPEDVPCSALFVSLARRSSPHWRYPAPRPPTPRRRRSPVASATSQPPTPTHAQRDQTRHALEVEGWRVAPALLAAGRPDKAGELLERSAVAAAATPNDPVAVRHYAAFVALRGQLPEQLARWRKLAEKSAT